MRRKIVRTCGSNCPEISLPASSRVAVWPASQTVRPPCVMTAGEYARAAWNSVLSRYSTMAQLRAWLTGRDSDIFFATASGERWFAGRRISKANAQVAHVTLHVMSEDNREGNRGNNRNAATTGD